MTPPNLYSIISDDSSEGSTESKNESSGIEEQSFSDFLWSGRLSDCIFEIEKHPKLLNGLVDDKTPFEISMLKGFTSLAEKLSEFENFDLEAAGHEPLRICVELGKTDLAKKLIERGANPNIYGEGGKSLLLMSLEKGDFELAECLLKGGAEIDCRDARGWSALIHASFCGWKGIAEFLLDHGASVNLCTNEGWNALVVAYAYGHSEIVELLQSHGGKFGEQFAKAALLQAYKNRSILLMKRLLSVGVSVDFQYDSKNTLLAQAAKDDEWLLVRDLLRAGANPNVRIDGQKPIIDQAIVQGQIEVLELLIENGASVNVKYGYMSPILYASRHNRKDMVDMLIKGGACLEVEDEDGDTPLLTAVKMEFHALAIFLLEKGADPEHRNREQNRALDYCTNSEVQKMLRANF